MTKFSPRRALSAFAGLVLVMGVIYLPPVYQSIGNRAVLWIYNLTVTLSALLGVALSFTLWRSFRPGEVLRKIWAYISLGLVLWTFGEAIWLYDQLLSHEALPSPSIADIAWIAGSILVAIGLYLRFRTLRMTPKKGWRSGILSVVVIIGILAAGFAILFIARSETYTLPINLFVYVFYSIGDLTLIFMTLSIALVLIGGRLSLPWGLIAFGFFIVGLSDLLYAFAIWEGIYQITPQGQLNIISSAINITYLAAYLSIDTGLYLQAQVQTLE